MSNKSKAEQLKEQEDRIDKLNNLKLEIEEKIFKAPDRTRILKLIEQGKMTKEQLEHNDRLLDSLNQKLEKIDYEIEICEIKKDNLLYGDTETNDKKSFREDKYAQAELEGLGMEWYKWNIYFRLFASIIYAWDDILIGIGVTIWILITWHWLFNFKYKGIINYFAVGYVVPIVLLLLTLSNENISYNLGAILGIAIFFLPEFKYWKKRAHLFDKTNEGTSLDCSRADTQNDKTEYKPRVNKANGFISFIKDKKVYLLSLIAIAVVIISLSSFFTYKILNLKQECNDLNARYNQLQSNYNDLKKQYETEKEKESNYDYGFRDGYDECLKDFKEMSPAERNDFLNDGI